MNTNNQIAETLKHSDVWQLPDFHFAQSGAKENIWEDAPQHRAELAQNLLRFVNAQRAPLCIGVNGAWGTGKTFFMSRFSSYVKQAGGLSVYLNAWKGDVFQLPLVYIYSEVAKQINGSEFEIVDRAALATFEGKAKKLLSNIIGVATGGVYKALIDGLSEEDSASLVGEYNNETKFARFVEQQFVALSKIAREKICRPLIIVIDELDRCRPTYAIKMLEAIKHTFRIDNCVFLIAADFEQLGKTINSVYGNIDADRYLDRFLQYRFDLPRYNPEEYFNIVWQELRLDEVLASQSRAMPNWVKTDLVKSIFARMIACQKVCALRDVELILRAYNIGLMQPIHATAEGVALAALTIIKVLHRSVYRSMKMGDFSKVDWLCLCFANMYDGKEYKEYVQTGFNGLFSLLESENSEAAWKARQEMEEIARDDFRKYYDGDLIFKLLGAIKEYSRIACDGYERTFESARLKDFLDRLDFTLGNNVGMLDLGEL